MEQSSTEDPKIKLKVISKGIWNKRARQKPKNDFDLVPSSLISAQVGLVLYSTVHVSAMQEIFAMICLASNG